MNDHQQEPTWLTEVHVKTLHEETLHLFGGSSGLRDEGLLHSALARPKQLYTYGDSPTIYELAAAYGLGLTKSHAFIDGNKRTALMAIRAFLFANGYRFVPEPAHTVVVMEGVASGKTSQDELATWIQDSSSRRRERT